MRIASFVLVGCLFLSVSSAQAASCSITGQGTYNNPPGLHVDYLCTLDPQEVATLSHPTTRSTIAAAAATVNPIVAVYIDQRIQQIQNGANANGALIKATIVNGNYLREFISHGR
jgi:hypothetical protein